MTHGLRLWPLLVHSQFTVLLARQSGSRQVCHSTVLHFLFCDAFISWFAVCCTAAARHRYRACLRVCCVVVVSRCILSGPLTSVYGVPVGAAPHTAQYAYHAATHSSTCTRYPVLPLPTQYYVSRRHGQLHAAVIPLHVQPHCSTVALCNVWTAPALERHSPLVARDPLL